MTRNQFKNLLAFVIILGNHPSIGDLSAPDYMIEKFARFLGSTADEVISDHANWQGGLDYRNRAVFREYVEQWGDHINAVTNDG